MADAWAIGSWATGAWATGSWGTGPPAVVPRRGGGIGKRRKLMYRGTVYTPRSPADAQRLIAGLIAAEERLLKEQESLLAAVSDAAMSDDATQMRRVMAQRIGKLRKRQEEARQEQMRVMDAILQDDEEVLILYATMH